MSARDFGSHFDIVGVQCILLRGFLSDYHLVKDNTDRTEGEKDEENKMHEKRMA